MKDIPALAIIPPGKKFDFDADGAESGGGLLDLDLEPSMRERKRKWMVKENAHWQIAARFVGAAE
jgi:hypothetical protein